VAFRNPNRQLSVFRAGRLRPLLLHSATIIALLLFSIAARGEAQSKASSPAPNDSITDSMPTKIDLVDGSDLRFRRLSADSGLSQTRAAWVVQDKVGFIWFGTQYGLNRYDGYKSKVFKHEPGRPDSLSCVYIRSLFVDHAGTLWVGCDRYLDRFEPATETFVHYRIDTETSDELSTPIDRIDEDRAGTLWLATAKGLYRFDPSTTRTARYVHDPHDATSIGDNRVNMSGEDREGHFWVANGEGLDQFDRKTGKVIGKASFRGEVSRFHEDESGLFWLAGRNYPCALAIWNPKTDAAKCHTLNYNLHGTPVRVVISEILEARDGVMWFGSTGGLLKFDQAHNRILRYHNNSSDKESLESDSLIFLNQDNEGNIWTCFQVVEPNFFSERPQPFESFTYQRGSILDPLVTSIYEDRNGILWIGSMGGMNRIDRRAGTNIASPHIGNETLALLEDRDGVLFSGTFHQGLRRLDRETGKPSGYFRGRLIETNPIMRLIYDHMGSLWAAMYGGVGRYDPTSGNFLRYTPENRNAIQYQEIKEDRDGFFWLGAQSGLHRFDPRTGHFKIYEHRADDPSSLSDNRINSILFDHQGALWVGTQDGLDKFDPATATFKTYYEKDGLAGEVVSCILEDRRGVLWMGTNNGLSSFDPHTESFQNFSSADGLPGQDMTGWGACYQSPSGEMFFGGFSGATAFYPSRIPNSSFAPRTILTDFQLSGNSVPVGAGSPLKQSITHTGSITLSHQQNIFSIEFSALSFFNAETNRYRYRLTNLDNAWHEVGSDRRIASYTTLPAGRYTFEVQGATSRGPWSNPGARLAIEILPEWYQTLWFRGICVAALLALLWSIYLLRLRELKRQFHTALVARVDERTRIARDLHDTLLQSFTAVLPHLQTVSNVLPSQPDEAKRRVDRAIEQATNAITDGRDAVHALRSGGSAATDLDFAISNFAKEFLSGTPAEPGPEIHVQIEGKPALLNPVVRDEVYRIATEAVRNAIRHANARRIEVEIRYDEQKLRLRIGDNGTGIDPVILNRDHKAGHWGLQGMRERAKLVGGTLEVWSQPNVGTEIELSIPAASVYARPPSVSRSVLSRFRRS
jgi:signal transduction histidine kinase/ligand-binding sensor domain-containing protein